MLSDSRASIARLWGLELDGDAVNDAPLRRLALRLSSFIPSLPSRTAETYATCNSLQSFFGRPLFLVLQDWPLGAPVVGTDAIRQSFLGLPLFLSQLGSSSAIVGSVAGDSLQPFLSLPLFLFNPNSSLGTKCSIHIDDIVSTVLLTKSS